MMRISRMASVSALLAIASGCTPVMLMQGAQPVGAGKTVVGAATSGEFDKGQGAARKEGNGSIGLTTVFLRRGLSDSIDAGVSVTPGGARADVKLSIPVGTGLRLAFDPGVAAGYAHDKEAGGAGPDTYLTNSFVQTSADATVILGYALGGGGEAYLAPRFAYISQVEKTKTVDPLNGNVSDTSHAWTHAWGAAIGATVPMGKLEVVPEIGLYDQESHSGGQITRSVFVVPGVGFRSRF